MHALSDGYNYTVPACLKPGYYLVRHEIIALHIAQTVGGAEFYPSCHQLKVSGSGTVTPTKLVSFPGAYKNHDPGVLFDMWKRTLPSLNFLLAQRLTRSQRAIIRFLVRLCLHAQRERFTSSG